MKTPRRHQAEAVKAVFDAFAAGVNRPLIDACVGSGKSLIIVLIALLAKQHGWRVLSLTHVRELVEQVVAEARAAGLTVGVNAAALNERAWRGQFIVAAIQSVFKYGRNFGPIDLLIIDETHLVPHGEAGMYRQLIRDLGVQRIIGLSGTVFRLQGGSLVEGEGALFEKVVYTYSILDGIRDGYLVPAFSATVDDKIDTSKLKVSQGEFTGSSQDAQMIEMMDNHLAQMRIVGADRKRWLLFEASTKAAKAMTKRMNEWGIPTGLVLGTTPAGERTNTIAAYRSGRLRALVNVAALTTGFDVQEVDMLVMRRATKSLGLYIQMIGRGLRTVGGNIDASIAAGKADCIVCDYSGVIDLHGPLDFIRPKETKSKLVSCESCGKRNAAAAMKCWSCDEPMTKRCPACLETIRKGLLDCPLCGHDMRVGGDPASPPAQKLLERPSGAALIASFAKNVDREGGWIAIRKSYRHETGETIVDTESHRLTLPATLQVYGDKAKWIRTTPDGTEVVGLLLPNGASRTSALQISLDGPPIVVPIPSQSSVETTHDNAA